MRYEIKFQDQKGEPWIIYVRWVKNKQLFLNNAKGKQKIHLVWFLAPTEHFFPLSPSGYPVPRRLLSSALIFCSFWIVFDKKQP